MDEGEEYNIDIVGNTVALIEKAAISKDQIAKLSDGRSSTSYQPRTLRPGSTTSERRADMLPAYPLSKNDEQRILLLLSNVPNVDRDKCEQESFCGGNGVCPFELKQHRYVEAIDSFMMDIYRDLFIEPSRQWKIHYSLIDYNLSRLRKCMEIYRKQTKEPALSSLNELTIALEFYLQIDVDTFFMKTCTYRGNNFDNTEGILCQTEPPTAHYRMMPCFQRNCFLCESRNERRTSDEPSKFGVHFSLNQVHRFVNKYEAYLNCHVNCNTRNIIYALTCPCEKYDYIESTSMSFHDRILKHRDENNRIIREFLIGMNNVDHLLKEKSRSAETVANNNMLLYQHSPRCLLVLQHFLDHNPEYWCLIPILCNEARADDNAYASTFSASSAAHSIYMTAPQLQPESPTFAKKPKFFEAVLRNSTRSEEQCIWLVKGLPKPPLGYRFTRRQIEEQLDFFKFHKETRILPANLVDCYKYTIIAVMPDSCSYELRRFIEALFITHAETKLNTFGRLTHVGSFPLSTTPLDHANRGKWCEKLVRHV